MASSLNICSIISLDHLPLLGRHLSLQLLAKQWGTDCVMRWPITVRERHTGALCCWDLEDLHMLQPLSCNCLLVDEWCSTNTGHLCGPVILIWSFHLLAFQQWFQILTILYWRPSADMYPIHFPLETQNPPQIVGNILLAPFVCHPLMSLLVEPRCLVMAIVSRFGKDKGDDPQANQTRCPVEGPKRRINRFRDIKSVLLGPEYPMKMGMGRSICPVVKA